MRLIVRTSPLPYELLTRTEYRDNVLIFIYPMRVPLTGNDAAKIARGRGEEAGLSRRTTRKGINEVGSHLQSVEAESGDSKVASPIQRRSTAISNLTSVRS